MLGSRNRVIAVLSVAALLLLAGGGAYVYIAINKPGLLMSARPSSSPPSATPIRAAGGKSAAADPEFSPCCKPCSLNCSTRSLNCSISPVPRKTLAIACRRHQFAKR